MYEFTRRRSETSGAVLLFGGDHAIGINNGLRLQEHQGATTHRSGGDMKQVPLLCVLAVLTATLFTPAFAAGLAKEGSYEGLTCFTGPVNVVTNGKGDVAGSYDLTGTPLRKEGEFGYLASQRCVGFFSVVGGEYTNSGMCATIDPDGDRGLFVFSRRGQEIGSWRAISGTGKYEGAEASGTWMPAVTPPKPIRSDVLQSCNRETGRWKLK